MMDEKKIFDLILAILTLGVSKLFKRKKRV